MLSKFNSLGVLTLILVAFLLFSCFTGSAVYGGGGGGQWTDDLPPIPNSGGSEGGDGSSIIIALMTMLQLIL